MGNNAPGQGGIPGWGQPQQPQEPQQPQQPGWGAPPPQAPQQPGWGQPQQPQEPQQPQQPGWGAPPPQAPQQPGWGAPPPQAPQQPGWGAPPPQAPQQPGWGTPPPQQAGWAPQAAPKQGGNGCLKACLIVAVIGVVLVIAALIAIFALGSSFLGGLGLQPNGQLADCPFVSNASLETVLGKDTVASQLTGLADATLGQVLDKRVIKDAPQCWVGAGSNTSGGFGRIAKYTGSDASSKFDAERTAAQSGGYLGSDVSGLGDQAFCTVAGAFPATGVLVRKGSDLVYVSLIGGDIPSSGIPAPTCDLVSQIAALVIK